ncbi:MAG: hypothetical protein L3J56_06840 [Bacteroidales bacterium]|nr:hypothetical protein [Bacteroidales bacterium]
MDFSDIIKAFEEKHQSTEIDLTDEFQSSEIEQLAEELFLTAASSEELKNLEKETAKKKKTHSILVYSAIKIALSKKNLSEINKIVHFTIVFAVYKENIRILTKKEHPNGEDFLIRKIKQLENLVGKFPNISWDMLVVDDGCPENSGKIAEKVLKERYSENNVKVLYLQDAIDNNLKIAKGLTSADDSRKGGAVEYGMWYAAERNIKNHIIIYTDADLSTHLGQIGLLAEPLINEGKFAAVASRREDLSVVIKKGTRDKRGKLFIYLWKRMIRRLNYITDTQCGFKAFRADVVKKIILNNFEKKFAFDIELLIKTDMLERESIAKVAIVWIDSEAELTTTDLQPYIEMLKAIADMYFKYLSANAFSHSFAFFVKSLNKEKWDILVNHVPEGILIKSAIHYDKYDEIKVPVFQKIIEKNR